MKTKDKMINVAKNYVLNGFVVECIATRQGIPNTPETFEGIIDTGSGGTCVSEDVMNRIKIVLKSKNFTPIEPVGFVKMRGVDSEYVICDVYQISSSLVYFWSNIINQFSYYRKEEFTL